jgi:hypothetical protein
MVIENYIKKFGKDYRYEDKSHPIKALQNKKKDCVTCGVICQY